MRDGTRSFGKAQETQVFPDQRRTKPEERFKSKEHTYLRCLGNFLIHQFSKCIVLTHVYQGFDFVFMLSLVLNQMSSHQMRKHKHST